MSTGLRNLTSRHAVKEDGCRSKMEKTGAWLPLVPRGLHL